MNENSETLPLLAVIFPNQSRHCSNFNASAAYYSPTCNSVNHEIFDNFMQVVQSIISPEVPDRFMVSGLYLSVLYDDSLSLQLVLPPSGELGRTVPRSEQLVTLGLQLGLLCGVRGP